MANKLLVADTQQQNSASRRLLHVGQCRRYAPAKHALPGFNVPIEAIANPLPVDST